MPWLICAILALAALTVAAGYSAPARAEKRVALVIGNDRYANLPAEKQLLKAEKDAEAVGDALTQLGFNVIRGQNLGRQGMIDKLSAFTAQLEPGDTAAFFYAGHGVAIGGVNYLVPSDVPAVTPDAEARVRGNSIAEGDIVGEIQAKGARVAVLVIDACRDNPFPRSGTRSIGNTRGLADAKPARGVFTIYSAGIGQTALDRMEKNDPNPNSVFTRVFVQQLARADRRLVDIVVEVREQVAELALKAKDDAGRPEPHEQTPAYYDQTIGGHIYLAGRTPPPKAGRDPDGKEQSQRGPAAQQVTNAPSSGAEAPESKDAKITSLQQRPKVLDENLASRPGAVQTPQKRVALVIGNGAYQTLPRLGNATADARDIGRALEGTGFETTIKTDVKLRELYQLIDAFAARIAGSPDTVGLFYYSGHGIQTNGRNYLVPVDAALTSDADFEAEAADAGKVLRAMDEAHNRINIVILDACRDNPLPKGRSLARGLTAMRAVPGTFIGYAAAPGQTALDVEPGENSVFTGVLIKQLKVPGLRLEEMFERVIAGVSERTGGKQSPWMASSVPGDFYFLGSNAASVTPPIGDCIPIGDRPRDRVLAVIPPDAPVTCGRS